MGLAEFLSKLKKSATETAVALDPVRASMIDYEYSRIENANSETIKSVIAKCERSINRIRILLSEVNKTLETKITELSTKNNIRELEPYSREVKHLREQSLYCNSLIEKFQAKIQFLNKIELNLQAQPEEKFGYTKVFCNQLLGIDEKYSKMIDYGNMQHIQSSLETKMQQHYSASAPPKNPGVSRLTIN